MASNLTSYLPSSVLNYLIGHTQLIPPIKDDYETVVLFADVSGYTAMCEAMSEQGNDGDENLAKTLRSYFELLIKAISKQGGDVFKFAGDAILVVWPPSEESLTTKVRRATQSGLQIRESLQDAVLAHGVRLSVKIGIGAGDIGILHLGGIFGRLEYLAVGEPLVQAFTAEHHATKTELVLSPKAWSLVKNYFEGEELDDKHAFITKCTDPLRAISVAMASTSQKELDAKILERMLSYIPTAAIPFAGHGNDNWVNEIRTITCLFVNLGMEEKDLVNVSNKGGDLQRINTVLRAVQEAVYKYEGSLNKFLMDDKGSTLIAVFGLPPLAHQDDSIRGVMSALAIRTALNQLGLRCSVGITTGQAYCGVIGNILRREYSVLGDVVNLAARLMQHCNTTGAGILCDTNTKEICEHTFSLYHDLNFFSIGAVQVKGKSKSIPIFQPQLPLQLDYMRASIKLQVILENQKKQTKKTPGVEESTVVSDSELQTKCAQLFSVITNCKESKVVLLVALPGLGKSVLLMSALRKLGPESLVVFAAGYPYDNGVFPLYTFRTVFLQLLTRIENVKITNNARKWVRAHLPKSKHLLVSVLNDILQLNFEESEESQLLTKEERLKESRTLLLMLFQVLVPQLQVGRLVVAIEDAVYLDSHSWIFISMLCGTVPNMSVVVVTRPLTKTFMNAFATRVPPDGLDVLLRSTHCTTIQIMPREDALIARISAQSFVRNPPSSTGSGGSSGGNSGKELQENNVIKFRPVLIELCLDRARGNPLYASELLKFFQANDYIYSNEGMIIPKTSICPESNENENNPKLLATPLPFRLISLLNLQLDRLSQPQLSMLKVAAVLGNCFSLKLVKLCQPFDADDNLEEAFEELLALVIVSKVPPPNLLTETVVLETKEGEKEKESEDREREKREEEEREGYYTFTDGLMRHVILSRMLVSHQETLISKIKKNSNLFRDDEPLTTAISGGPKKFKESICEGSLRKKQQGGMKRWNQKYFVLTHDKLSYYDYVETGKQEIKEKPKTEMILSNETVIEIKNVNTIFITPSLAGTRKLEVMADLPDQATLWIDFLQKVTKKKARQFYSQVENNLTPQVVSSMNMPKLQHTKRGFGTRDKSSIFIAGTENGGNSSSNSSGSSSSGSGSSSSGSGNMNSLQTKRFNESVKEAWLMKRGTSIKSWKKRYFVLFKDKLQYFETNTPQSPVKGEMVFGFETKAEKLTFGKEVGYAFVVSISPTAPRRYHLATETEEERKEWIDLVNQFARISSLPKQSSKMAAHSVLEGRLRKKGGTLGNWTNRYFVLFNDRMEYFVDKSAEARKGEIPIYKETTVGESDSKEHIFFFKSSNEAKTYFLGALTHEEMERWIAAIKLQVQNAPKYVPPIKEKK